VEEEEQLMLAMVEKEIPADDKEDEEVLAAVAHFIMVHYEEKEGIKKKKKKSISPRLGSTRWRGVLNDSVNGGEIAVTNELDQFNKYKVFEPKHAYDLSEEDRKKELSLLIIRKEERNNKGKVLCKRECPKGACCKRGSSGANGWT